MNDTLQVILAVTAISAALAILMFIRTRARLVRKALLGEISRKVEKIRRESYALQPRLLILGSLAL
jgi:hypothetical protein